MMSLVYCRWFSEIIGMIQILICQFLANYAGKDLHPSQNRIIRCALKAMTKTVTKIKCAILYKS